MSVAMVTMVMAHYPGAGGEYTLALCLADVANNEGQSIWPSVRTLAHNSRQSERTVQRQLRAMETTGWLICVSRNVGGKGHPNRYHINPDWIAQPDRWQPKGDNLTPFEAEPRHSCVTLSDAQRVTNPAPKGDTTVTPKQLQNLSNNPSLSPQTGEQQRPAVEDLTGEHSDIAKTARWMLAKIRLLNSDHAEPKWRGWHEDIRLMVQRDKRTLHEIRDLFGWANADPFWQTNILSPGKLRKKWDVLTIKRKASSGSLGQHGTSADYRCATHPDRQGRRSIPGHGWCCADCIEIIEREAAHA
jgi:hypothetical protein